MYIHRFRSADIGFFLEYIRLYSGYTGFYLEHLDEFFFPAQRAPDVGSPDTPPVNAASNMPAVAVGRKGKGGRENTRQRCIGV